MGIIVTLRSSDDTVEGSLCEKPLQREDVLVRRLADVTSQAVEKGLGAKVSVAMEKSVFCS